MALRAAQVDAPGWRAAAPSDDAAIVALCLALYTEDPGPAPIAAAQVLRTLAQLRAEPAQGNALVLELERRIVGYALLVSFWSNEAGGALCTIDELYVAPALRSRGHASALIGSLTSGRGPVAEHAVGVSLEVTSANAGALALYQRLGFKLGNRLLRKMIPIALLLCPLAAFAGAPPAIPETPHTSVASATVLTGNRELTDDALRAALTAEAATTVDDAARIVEAVYLTRGYVKARVQGAIDPLTRKPTLSIAEGALYTLRGCNVLELGPRKKDKLADRAAVCSLLPMRNGDAFAKAPVHAWMAAIRARYQRAGLESILLTPITSIDSEAHTIAITMEITR